MYRLFIVEDDPGIAEAVARRAESWGFEVRCAVNLRDVTSEFLSYDPHLVMLDISLPFFNGYFWCGEIRKHSNVPILFISSASDNMNIVMAMNMGGDDFIAKPFDGDVLMAKIQALLRRTYSYSYEPISLSCRGAVLDQDSQTLNFEGSDIPLTKNEYKILYALLKNKGSIVSRERLMEYLWSTDSFIDENTLTVNVNRLRKKLDKSGLAGFITTKFGVGYMIEKDEDM